MIEQKSPDVSYRTFKTLEAGGGGFCSVHSLEYYISGKKKAGRDFMTRYKTWALDKGNPYPKVSDFMNWSRSDWASPVSMFDMLRDMGVELPFIIMDIGGRAGKEYSLRDLLKSLCESERRRLVKVKNPIFIVGTGYHWMPIKEVINEIVLEKGSEKRIIFKVINSDIGDN